MAEITTDLIKTTHDLVKDLTRGREKDVKSIDVTFKDVSSYEATFTCYGPVIKIEFK